MSDERYKWLLIVSSITVLLVSFIWKYPDAVKANATKDRKLGDYVYVDPRTIIHTSRKCSKLNYKGWKSKRIKLNDFYFYFKDTPIKDISFCPNCVSDKDYEKIINIFTKQIEEEIDAKIERRTENL